MRARLDRGNQTALQKQACVNKRSATAELNMILKAYFAEIKRILEEEQAKKP